MTLINRMPRDVVPTSAWNVKLRWVSRPGLLQSKPAGRLSPQCGLTTNLLPGLRVACDACDTMIELDLTVKRRAPDAPISVALADIRCPRCNGHGRPHVIGLERFPSR